MKQGRRGFRFWYYFRSGYGTYFAFILAATNTLTVTYYLAIEKFPVIQGIFPTFSQYIIIMVCIGIPLLTVVGYVHYKRTVALKSEAEIQVESNPFQQRNIVNITLVLLLTLKVNQMVIKLSKNEKLTNEELVEITQLQDEIKHFVDMRHFADKKDLKFLLEKIVAE